VGKALMRAVIEHGKAQPRLRGIRLVQEAFNTASMSLYASLGFDAKEPLAVVQGIPPDRPAASRESRPMTERDLDRCAALCE
ncbi:GNAT family N-acetyltransferase, partial [Salmonella sp. SAL4436]|uniref:GNAT family N-acetyltransferase n=1 Tax=Salmonella sp. SAL4436 TaxID=3159891 RepID=UPI00397C0AEC